MDIVVASIWGGILLMIALIAFVAFQQGLRHRRRVLLHQERLAAIEKGLELPTLEKEMEEQRQNRTNLLLLSGLRWISVGITGGFVLRVLALSEIGRQDAEFVPELAWIGLIPAGIGLSHLIAYWVGERRAKHTISR
jgi:hypothetical protein